MQKNTPYSDVASAIVTKFGGIRPLSALIGVPVETVRGWVASGVIPEKHRQTLIRVAKERGINHHPMDYVAYLFTVAA